MIIEIKQELSVIRYKNNPLHLNEQIEKVRIRKKERKKERKKLLNI
jgi:hypothetical protein